MSFWKDFNSLLNYRISYHIQNSFINAFNSSRRKEVLRKRNEVLTDNADEIIDLMYNNEFSKKRYQKKFKK